MDLKAIWEFIVGVIQKGLATMDWKAIWDFVVNLAKKFLGPPDIQNEEEFREWLKGSLSALAALAELVPGHVDDKAVALLDKIVASDEMWPIFYGLLVDAVTKPRDAETLKADNRVTLLSVQADGAESYVALIVQIVVFLVKLYLNWRKSSE